MELLIGKYEKELMNKLRLIALKKKTAYRDWEFGVDKQPGQRTDLEEIGQLIKSGRTPRSFGATHPSQYIRYYRGMHALALALSKPRKFKTQVTVIYGETGVGKSRWASETCLREFNSFRGDHDAPVRGANFENQSWRL